MRVGTASRLDKTSDELDPEPRSCISCWLVHRNNVALRVGIHSQPHLFLSKESSPPMTSSIVPQDSPAKHSLRLGTLFLLALALPACANMDESQQEQSEQVNSDKGKKKTGQQEGPKTSESTPEASNTEKSKDDPDKKKPKKSQKPDKPVKEKPQWDYEEGGDMGPELWGDLSPAYATCKSGQAQSPIDITKVKRDKNLPNIKVQYSSAPYEAVDTGHTIQINFPAGQFINVGDKQYELVQFHYHSGSEHTLRGKRYPMALHLVHKTKSGQLAVFGVLVKEGNRNKTLSLVLDNLPDPGSSVTKKKVKIDPSGILPLSLQYFAYDGSLTTPPCTEGVRWHVLRTPITASKEQIEAFKKLYGNTYRPIQALNKREVITKYHF